MVDINRIVRTEAQQLLMICSLLVSLRLIVTLLILVLYYSSF